jgi:Zn-dependent M28 family amino/carboxypeptidase
VYSADGSPQGSAEISELFFDYLDSQALTGEELDLEGRSDHGPFIRAGIPVGGLFTGAEDLKTSEEAELFGGTAGSPHDPCYHQACDTVENVDRVALDQMADAVAHIVAVLSMRDDPIQD